MPSPKTSRWMRVGLLVVVVAVIAGAAGYLALAGENGESTHRTAGAKRPNVLMILTDDERLDDMRVMPITRERIGAAGITFNEAFVTYPICCPSRVTLLTGQLTHNHKVFGNSPPIGGYLTYAPNQENSLPFWLRDSGYTTALVGKFLNGYGTENPIEVPPGWDHWRGLPGEEAYRMWGYQLNEDGKVRTIGRSDSEDPNLYQTDVLAGIAGDLIKKMASGDKPFFLQFSPTAPHSETARIGRVNPRPAPRHAGRHVGAGLPQTIAFNEELNTDKAAEAQFKPINRNAQEALADHARGRLESLLAIDEAVGRLLDALGDAGVLDDTLVVFTSDNGFLLGEHRIDGGKYFPYDPSTRVPLLMRGPGIPKGGVSGARVQNVDITATIVEATGISPGRVMDGRSLLPLARDPKLAPPRPMLFQGQPVGELTEDPAFTGPPVIRSEERNPGWVAVRSENWLWIVYDKGGRELYDLKADPDQLNSRAADPSLDELKRNLHKLLLTMRACQGENCWNIPSGP